MKFSSLFPNLKALDRTKKNFSLAREGQDRHPEKVVWKIFHRTNFKSTFKAHFKVQEMFSKWHLVNSEKTLMRSS